MEGAVYAVKALLAVERIRRLEKKRAHYDRSSKGSAVSLATRRMNPHRSARTLTRTCLAKGSMETAIDVPSVRMGREGQWKRWLRKPSVSPIFNLEREVSLRGAKVQARTAEELQDECTQYFNEMDDLEARFKCLRTVADASPPASSEVGDEKTLEIPIRSLLESMAGGGSSGASLAP
ncbi:unnamed protein product, partial [Polarella glacialis]